MKGDKMVGAHGRTGEIINAYRVLGRKDEGNGPLGRCKCRWKDIKLYLRRMKWMDVDWINGSRRGQVAGCF
jgi:hypothetical protein